MNRRGDPTGAYKLISIGLFFPDVIKIGNFWMDLSIYTHFSKTTSSFGSFFSLSNRLSAIYIGTD